MPQDDVTCSTPSCLTDRQVKEAVLATKMNTIIGLSLTAVSLLGYSILWQAPAMKAEQTEKINQVKVELATETHQRSMADREARVDIERLKEQMNAVEKRIGE
jgi:hypothetical protein